MRRKYANMNSLQQRELKINDFFSWNFFCLGFIENGEGLGNYQKFFPEIFFRGGVLEMREKNSWRIFTELFAQN